MFDRFNPFQRLQKQSFSFQSKRYEIWMNGQMIKNGKTNAKIGSKLIYDNGIQKVDVIYDDPILFDELAQNNTFDEFVTATDRLQLITIPAQTNSQNMGIMSFLMALGATRSVKNFAKNEPYCCNLFLQNGEIVKITFSFSIPEKLVEFYSDDDKDYTPNDNLLRDIIEELGL